MIRKAVNGNLVDYDFKQLMNNVKERGQSLFVELDHNDKRYYVSIHFEELFGVINPKTKYWIDVVEEDEDGNQKCISNDYLHSNLFDCDVVVMLNHIKDVIVNTKIKKARKPRKKNRRYPGTEAIKQALNEYFALYKNDVIDDLISNTPFTSFNDVVDAERRSYWGLDCGWVWLATSNPEQEREWRLDNGKYDAKVTSINYPFNCQSVTLKQIQLRKAIKDLGLEGQYYPEVRLD